MVSPQGMKSKYQRPKKWEKVISSIEHPTMQLLILTEIIILKYGAEMCRIFSFENGTDIHYHMILTFTELFGLVRYGAKMNQIA